jgi:CRISPR-associated protein (TIGR03986 family)
MADWKDALMNVGDENFKKEREKVSKERDSAETAEQLRLEKVKRERELAEAAGKLRAEEAKWVRGFKLDGFDYNNATKSYERNNHHFINPYTFLFTNKKVERKAEVSTEKNTEADLYTGYFDCTLEIRDGSALFIPNTTKVFKLPLQNNGSHPCYDFYSYEDHKGRDDADFPDNLPKIEPVIPGSELRGMVRNVYEQLTNSCFAVIGKTNYPFKRTTEPKKPYKLCYDGKDWKLFDIPGDKIFKLNHDEDSKVHHGVCANASDNYKTYKITKKSDDKRGKPIADEIVPDTKGQYHLHITGDFKTPDGSRHFTLVDFSTASAIGATVEKEVIERLGRVVDDYCKVQPGSQENHIKAAADYEVYRARLKSKGPSKPLLVYADSTLSYLSPACITKEFFSNKIADILEAQGERKPCSERDSTDLCPACQLFGTIGKRSLGSRVRFSDTYEVRDDYELECVTLPILSSPRISATEFYLKKPTRMAKDKGTWNYDYYKKVGAKRVFAMPVLSGRKVYWHGPRPTNNQVSESMNNTVRVLTKAQFKFKVFFEDISEEELIDLSLSISLPADGFHKLGHGKPIGMGSVKAGINDLKIRTYSLSGEGDAQRITVAWSPDRVKKIGQHNLTRAERTEKAAKVLQYTKPLEDEFTALVDYPRNQKGGDIFAWFGGNRGGVKKEQIVQPLQTIDTDA